MISHSYWYNSSNKQKYVFILVGFIRFESKDLSTDHIWSKSKSVTPVGESLSGWFGSHDIPGFWLEDHPNNMF